MKLTKPEEFKKFNKLLTHNTPWKPWYFKLRVDKDPLEGISWKALSSKMSPRQAYNWMKAGYNIGIAATNMDPLVIIDVDDVTMIPDSMMKPTLTVTSRKRLGRHYFYLTEDARCKVNIPTDEYGEMRAMWQYVVAPGSYVTTSDELIKKMPDEEKEYAGYYTVSNKITPKYIKYDDIPEIFRNVIEAEKRRKRVKKINTNKNGSALYNLTVDDIFNIPDKKTRFPSLFHGSETGKNTSMDGDWLICWRHNVSHSPLSALAVICGLATCQEAGYGHDNAGIGTSTIDFKDGEIIYKLWKVAKEKSLIPENDIMPSRAKQYLERRFK